MYRSLFLVVLGLTMTGCAVYDYDPGYSRGYYHNSYRVETYPQSYYYYQEPRRYPAHRYYQAPPVRHHGRSEYRPPVTHQAPRMHQPSRSHQGPRLQAPRNERHDGRRAYERRHEPRQQPRGESRPQRGNREGGYRSQQGHNGPGQNHPGGRH